MVEGTLDESPSSPPASRLPYDTLVSYRFFPSLAHFLRPLSARVGHLVLRLNRVVVPSCLGGLPLISQPDRSSSLPPTPGWHGRQLVAPADRVALKPTRCFLDRGLVVIPTRRIIE